MRRSWLAIAAVTVLCMGIAPLYAVTGAYHGASNRPGHYQPQGSSHSNNQHNSHHSSQTYNPNYGQSHHSQPGGQSYNPSYTNQHSSHYVKPQNTADLRFYRALKRDMEVLAHYIRDQRPRLAQRQIQRMDAALAGRWSAFDRQLRNSFQRISRSVRDRRYRAASGMLRGNLRELDQVIKNLSNQGGHGQDVQAHREWIRDIRDLIDTLRDGNIRMARRDLQTLIRDVRLDGSPSSFNRRIERRLRYIARDLAQPRPRVREIIRELRSVQQDLRNP